jgi:hypothetical protein
MDSSTPTPERGSSHRVQRLASHQWDMACAIVDGINICRAEG